jgi:hypothetical protein
VGGLLLLVLDFVELGRVLLLRDDGELKGLFRELASHGGWKPGGPPITGGSVMREERGNKIQTWRSHN